MDFEFDASKLPATIIIYGVIMVALIFSSWGLFNKILIGVLLLPITYIIVTIIGNR